MHKNGSDLTRGIQDIMGRYVQSDSFVSCILVIMVFLHTWFDIYSNHIKIDDDLNSLVMRFWYNCSMTLALLYLLFLFMKLGMVQKHRVFNPSSAWISPVIHLPIGIFLLLALLNSYIASRIAVWSSLALAPKSRVKQENWRLQTIKNQFNVYIFVMIGTLSICLFNSNR
jgi:hypothetical protein